VSFETLRDDARHLFQAGVNAADPYLAVKKHLDVNFLSEKVHLIAFGKAACTMSKAACDVISTHRLVSALAVTNYENVRPIASVTVLGAGHPLPDENGFYAAQQVAERAIQAQADETLLVLISGGGSALLPYPVDGLSLAEKRITADLLLASGATIQEINCVRKHLSVLKGGGLARLAYPAKIYALILSDVLGDDMSTIASGLTVPDDSTYDDACVVLKKYQLWEKVPPIVRDILVQARHETPKTGDAIFQQNQAILIGSNAGSVKAMEAFAQKQGYDAQLYHTMLCGIAREEAERWVLYVKRQLEEGVLTQPSALLAGGETTVILKGSGKGGRNQEMALAFACAAEKYHLPACWVFLSGGTEGRDGPTEAAGGIVDGNSLAKMRQAHQNPEQHLNNNNAYIALNSVGDLLITGATGTNVADLQILLVNPALQSF
jgi:glycerate 2-kinase